MSRAPRARLLVVIGCLAVSFAFLIGCTSMKVAAPPPAEPPVPLPMVVPAAGPPPDFVAPTNYWVRERIILSSEPEPASSMPRKPAVKQKKRSQKTSG